MLCRLALEGLAAIRKEWELAAGDSTSLLEVQAPVGLLLVDICQALDLEPADRLEVLGLALSAELQIELAPE